jgi:hypothetical protein
MKSFISISIFAFSLAAFAGSAHATKFDCAPASVVGPGWQVGTFPGRVWETSFSYTDFSTVDRSTAGQGQFWYCLLPVLPLTPAAVSAASIPSGGVAATPGVTGIVARSVGGYVVVEGWHANPEQASKMPDNIIAQIWSHGKITIEQRLPIQCFEMAARGWYPNGAEKRLCEGMLRHAVAIGPK